MRKLFLLLLVACLFLSMAACSPQEEVVSPTESSSVTVSNLPFDADIDNKTITINEVTFADIYADHGYTLWVFISLDRKNLSEDDIYWLTKADSSFRKVLDSDVYQVSWEGTTVHTDSLHPAGSFYDDEVLCFGFYGDISREKNTTGEYSWCIRYTPDSIVDPTAKRYYGSFDITETNYFEGINHLTPHQIEYFGLK